MTNASLSIFVLILNHLLDITEDGEASLGLASIIYLLSCAPQRGSFRRGFLRRGFLEVVRRFLRVEVLILVVV